MLCNRALQGDEGFLRGFRVNSPLCFCLGVCPEGGKVTRSGDKGDEEGFCTGREAGGGGFWKSVGAAAGNGDGNGDGDGDGGDGNSCCLLS